LSRSGAAESAGGEQRQPGGEGALLIRRATAADAAAIATLLRAAFDAHRGSYPPAAWRATTPGPPAVIARLEEGPVWFASRDATPVGTLSAVVMEDEFHLRSLAVDPAARRNGVAAALLHAADEEARARRLRALSLETAVFLETAVALYERLGFETRASGDHHGLHTLWMTRETAVPWPS
jgi:ribosomal protein S18 acetylase RimI-like enzyme